MLNLLRPLLKQTVTYRYLRGREVVAHGTGWVERIVDRCRRRLHLLHAAGDHAEHRFLRASRVRDPARPAPRLHPRPGRRAGGRRVRAGRPGHGRGPLVAVRPDPARVRDARSTSRWSCSASTPTRTSSRSGGRHRGRPGAGTATDGGSAARRAVVARPEPALGLGASRGEGVERVDAIASYFKFSDRGTNLGHGGPGRPDHVHGHGLHHLREPGDPDRRVQGRDPACTSPAIAAATALVAGLMTIAMGVFANYPFALAAGLGINGIVAFALTGQGALARPARWA